MASSLVMLRYDSTLRPRIIEVPREKDSSYSVTETLTVWHLLSQLNFNIHRKTIVKTRICLKKELVFIFYPLSST